jgi:type IV secretory pathway TrbL component
MKQFLDPIRKKKLYELNLEFYQLNKQSQNYAIASKMYGVVVLLCLFQGKYKNLTFQIILHLHFFFFCFFLFFSVFFFFFQVLKFAAMSTKVNLMWLTVHRAILQLGIFLSFFCTIYVSYVLAGHLLFGPEVRHAYNLSNSNKCAHLNRLIEL